MIYFYCILVTLFRTGNAINSETRLRFLQDFILHQEKPTSVVSFIPSCDHDKLQLQKGLAESRRTSLYLQDIHNSTSRDINFLFLLELSQKNSREILIKAEQSNLLKVPIRWIIFVETRNSSDINNNEVETLKKKVDDQLKDVFLAMDTEVYFALELIDSDLDLFLAYKKRPNIPLEWEQYAKWDKAFDRPKPKNVLAMRRRNIDCQNVTAIFVITDPRSMGHMENYLNMQIDTTSKLLYHLTMHMFEWLNATGQLNITNSWGYQQPDGTFDGAIQEMEEDRSDFSGTVFFVMKERMVSVDYVMAPAAIAVLFIFKKPTLPSVANIYALPFDKYVWLSILVLFVASILALSVASIIELFLNNTGSKKPFTQTLSQSFVDTLGIVFQQGIETIPNSIGSRQMLLLSLMSFMFLYTAYSANVVALLQSTTNEINSIEALLKSPMQIGSQDLIYTRHIFPHETRPIHRALWLKKGLPQGEKFYMSLPEGMRKVREGMYAFHVEEMAGYDEIQKTFQENEKCHISIMPFVTFSYPYFVISKKSHYKEQLRIGAFRMKENGVQARSNTRLSLKRPQCDAGAAVFTAVGIIDVAPAFTVMLAIYGVAVLVLALEIWVHHATRNVESCEDGDRNISTKLIHFNCFAFGKPYHNEN